MAQLRAVRSARSGRILRIYGAIAVLGRPRSYTGRLALMCLCGAYLPLVVAGGLLAWLEPSAFGPSAMLLLAGSAVVGSAVAVAALHGGLSPVRLSSAALADYAAERRMPDLPTAYGDGAGRLMAEVQNTLSNFELALAELGRRADTDVLTGLSNRRCFFARAAEELARARRNGDCVSLIQFDIDHFKTINDTYGHATGDSVLRLLTGAVARQLRVYDGFSRIGGEEFAILLPGARMQDAVSVAERLRTTLASMDLPIVGHPVTASFGVATLEAEDRGVDDLLHRADLALYDAKRGGRDRVTWRIEEHEEIAPAETGGMVELPTPLAAVAGDARVWEVD